MSATFEAVAWFDTYAIASLVASFLTEVGFHPAPVAEAPHVQLAGADRVFTVKVRAEEHQAAVEFLEENGYGKHVVSA